eukprot:1160905-Pelagomonas_calceolata.AAC.9
MLHTENQRRVGEQPREVEHGRAYTEPGNRMQIDHEQHIYTSLHVYHCFKQKVLSRDHSCVSSQVQLSMASPASIIDA